MSSQKPNFFCSPLKFEDAIEVARLWSDVAKASPFPLGGSWNEFKIGQSLLHGAGLGLFESGERDQPLRSALLYHMGAESLDIDLVCTDPGFRRQGLFRMLLGECLKIHTDIREIWLEVHQANVGAMEAYMKMNFREVGRRKDYYGPGATCILFTLKVAEHR